MENVSVAGLDLNTCVWQAESRSLLPMQLYHHSMFWDAGERRYTIFGGFGNMRYSRDFYTFTPQDDRWERIEELKGDTLYPRYFSSMGYRAGERAAYVFGGMGNHSGEQIVGRVYFYDLHRVDFAAGRIEKLWEIPWTGPNVVPVRGMVLDGDYFYTLCYPEYISQSHLRLYRFSLRDGSYEILGDSIPIHSDKITTNANLYYDEQMNRLFATVQEFEANDRTSTMKIYSLAFPPVTAESLAAYPLRSHRSGWIAALVAAALAVVAGGALRRRMRARRAAAAALPEQGAEQGADVVQPNSMLLFGPFTVRNRHNRDITYLFSTRLKQMLCLILEHSGDEEGITSQKLGNLLWPGEPKDNVKNLRGVTINHLRKIFSEIDGIELVYNKGFFRIVCHPGFYCDYLRCLEITATEEGRADRDELLRLLARGKFLQGADLPLYDSFKGKVETRLEPLLLVELERSYDAEEYAQTLRAAEALCNIDPWNERALSYRIRALQRLRRSEDAYLSYRTYVTEYKRVFGTDYPRPYKEL